jgi:hypothetical protein
LLGWTGIANTLDCPSRSNAPAVMITDRSLE